MATIQLANKSSGDDFTAQHHNLMIKSSLVASFIIWKDGSTYYRRNVLTGQVDSGLVASTIIQGAIDDLATTGGRIFIRRGLYDLGSTGLTVHLDTGVEYIIEGETSYTELRYTGTGYAITFTGSATTHFSIVRNLFINGVSITAGRHGILIDAHAGRPFIVEQVWIMYMDRGIHLTDVNSIQIKAVTVEHGNTGVLIDAGIHTQPNVIWINDCRFAILATVGIRFNDYGCSQKIERCSFEQCGTGIYFEASSNYGVHACYFEDSTTYDIHIEGVDVTHPAFVGIIENGMFNSSCNWAVHTNHCLNLTIRSCWSGSHATGFLHNLLNDDVYFEHNKIDDPSIAFDMVQLIAKGFGYEKIGNDTFPNGVQSFAFAHGMVDEPRWVGIDWRDDISDGGVTPRDWWIVTDAVNITIWLSAVSGATYRFRWKASVGQY